MFKKYFLYTFTLQGNWMYLIPRVLSFAYNHKNTAHGSLPDIPIWRKFWPRVIVRNTTRTYHLSRKYTEKNASPTSYLWHIGWKCPKWAVYFKFYHLFNHLDKYHTPSTRKEYGMKKTAHKNTQVCSNFSHAF